MTRSYGLLLIGMLLAGLLLVWAGHARRSAPTTSALAAPPRTELVEITLRASAVEPRSVVVPKNSRVRLRVVNGEGHATRLTLAGYEDRFEPVALGPGESAEREFLADRPGEDFPWVVDGVPLGRLQVSGSHLVEGHR